ncbi:MAG: mucoidy inhibitor MuiA family protein [Deltaproteobacteria bacterium]|nr:mucoidy inhibitor MuiA family protein [Deltaproteobacteria bacterium]
MKKKSCAKRVWIISLLALGCAHGTAAVPVANPADTVAKADKPDIADVLNTSDNAENPDETTLQSTVTAVTVYSDRARVTRQAAATLTDKPQVFAFRTLPGWVDDGSVRVSASEGRILDVRVERDFLARTTDTTYRKAEDEHKVLLNKLAAVNDEIAVLDAEKLQIESIKAFSLEKITQDTTIGNVSVQSYGDVLTFISDALRATAANRRKAQRHLDNLTPRIEASARKLEDMKSLLSLEQTTVFVVMEGNGANNSTLELTYMMPGATWEPMHELRLDTANPDDVEVISFAQVTQTSGEDWDKAKLSFSTQSTVQSVRIPEIEALTLGGTQTVDRIMTSRMSSFTRARQAYEGQSRLWNKVRNSMAQKESANFEKVYESNMEYLQVVQSKTVQIFESLENRGTTAHFKATAINRVRGDGHPARMRIGYSNLKSSQKIIAVPEQSLNAARTLDMINTTGQALLPGKVALYRNGAFIGVTDMDFIAREENFALFFGVADNIKLSRTLDRKQSSLIQKKTSRMKVAFIVTAENLLNEETALTLADRVPVSENREIKVSNVKITPGGTPDSKGILQWNLMLKPNEKREFTISYVVDYPAELIIDTRRQRNLNSPLNSNAPAKSRKMEEYQIQDQLLDLEEML